MKYKVQIAFITSDHRVIKPGIYDESEIDVAEAKRKSIITHVNASDIVSETSEDTVKETTMTKTEDLHVKDFSPKVSIKKIDSLKINSAEIEELEKLKFVGKKTALKVIKERETKKFANYLDLDTRVPVKAVRSWEDITLIDFEVGNPADFNNTIKLF